MKRLLYALVLFMMFPICVNASSRTIENYNNVVNRTEYDVIVDDSSALKYDKEKKEEKTHVLVASEKVNNSSNDKGYVILISLSIVAIVMSTSIRFVRIGR